MDSKIPPHNDELEMAVIGDFIEYPEKRDEIMLSVKKEYFYNSENLLLFQKLLQIYSENQDFDKLVISSSELKPKAYKYVKCIEKAAISVVNVQGHIQDLIEIAQRRELFFLGKKIIDFCADFPSAKTKQAIELYLEKITNGKYHIKPISKIVSENSDEEGFQKMTTTLIRTGNKHWDDMVITKPGQFNLIAGRPSQGKTAFMLHLAKANASQGHRVGIISLEMPESSLAFRLAMSERGTSGNDFDKYLVGCSQIYNLPIYINDNENFDLAQIANIANAMIVRHNCNILYIDYLQLIRDDDSQTLYHQVTNLSRGLKHLAKKMNIPIYCLAQLNRASETRSNHRPMLSDLRDSGSIEQDADIIIFVYRPGKYDDIKALHQQKPEKSEFKDVKDIDSYFETIIAKQRDGRVGVFKWYYKPEINLFTPLDNYHEMDIQENIF